MAIKLNIKLIAEGIENFEQLNYLNKLNCFAGQGYLFSKPLPKQEFEKVLSLKRCEPLIINKDAAFYKDRRKYDRLEFSNLLEVNMTIKKFRGDELNIGDTKVLVKDISPGGLCFISNIKLPVNKEIELQFTVNLYRKELILQGNLVWFREDESNLYEYGVKLKNDEKQKKMLTRILNQLQIMMEDNLPDDKQISCCPKDYFN